MIEAHGVSLEYQYLRKNGRILGKTIFDEGLEAVYDMENREYTPVCHRVRILDAASQTEPAHLRLFGPRQSAKQDNHQGIITRDRFNQAKAEFARRNAGRAPSQKPAPTGRSCYSAKYALTERPVCGECGTLYRRCVWVKKGQKFAVWRCASRIDYGTKYCHDSPTLREEPLQAAILAAINTVMSQQEALVGQIEGAMRMELIPFPGAMSISDIDRRLDELDKEFRGLFADISTAESRSSRPSERNSDHDLYHWRHSWRLPAVQHQKFPSAKADEPQ